MAQYVTQYREMERSRILVSLGSSGASAASESEMDLVRDLPGEGSDEEDAFISFTTTESKCETLFQRGLELKIDGELEGALACFEDCLEGMQECQYFAKLPQTLQQLENLHRSLGHEEKAEDYGRAEKLFQEATQPQLATPLGVTQPRTKRRPFSKKPTRSPTASCNPGEYGNLMIKKAEEFDKLARFCVSKGEIDLALDYCKKVVVLRQCVYGQSQPVAEASLNYFGSLYGELEAGKGTISGNGTMPAMGETAVNIQSDISTAVKGDLSTAAHVGLLHSIEGKSTDRNRDIQSANCGGAHANMWSTGENTRTQYLAKGEEINSATPLKIGTSETTMANSRQHTECNGMTESQKFHTLPYEEHAAATKQETSPHFPSESFSGSAQECRANHIQNVQEVPPMGKANPGHWMIIPVQHTHPNNHHTQHHHNNNNLCKGVTKNLTKLSSELKAPMCVTVDVQTLRPGGGMEHPRCLPLWVLLLGAFVEMTLLAYMLYYH